MPKYTSATKPRILTALNPADNPMAKSVKSSSTTTFVAHLIAGVGGANPFEGTRRKSYRLGRLSFSVDEFYVDQADDYVSRIHIAFQAPSREAVQRFHEAGLAHGGTDNGAPGKRLYHSHYFAAFLLDPDGNNIEAICEEPVKRSSDAVVVERIARS